MVMVVMLVIVDLVGSDIIPSSTPPSYSNKPFLTSSLSGITALTFQTNKVSFFAEIFHLLC